MKKVRRSSLDFWGQWQGILRSSFMELLVSLEFSMSGMKKVMFRQGADLDVLKQHVKRFRFIQNVVESH